MRKKMLWLFAIMVVLIMSIPAHRALGEEADVTENTPAPPAPAAVGAVPPAVEQVRDPFEVQEESEATVVTTAQAVMDVKVEGIGIGSTNAYALLNGEVFYEGQVKGGIKLVRVGKEEVYLLVNGAPRKIKLIPEEEINRLEKMKEQKANAEKQSSADEEPGPEAELGVEKGSSAQKEL